MTRLSENVLRWDWTKQRLDAALLLAEDDLTDAEIAAQVGISDRHLRRWKDVPAFRAKVDEIAAEIEASILKRGIAKRRRRVAALVDRHRRMLRLLDARAEHYAHDPEAEPGADTGLLTKQYKVIGQGKSAMTVTEWAFDAALVREMREHEKQTAQEVGEWAERREVTGRNGEPIQIEATDARERLKAKITELKQRMALAPPGDNEGGEEHVA